MELTARSIILNGGVKSGNFQAKRPNSFVQEFRRCQAKRLDDGDRSSHGKLVCRQLLAADFLTLGIITKPDAVHIGSESEAAYLDLAGNEDVQFRLGWHVLRNQDFDTRYSSTAERNDAEQEFFSHGVWQTLPLHSLEVESLRPRLSNVFKEQITSELPELIRDIEFGLAHCRERLQHLGDARETANEQRLYLICISETFSSLLSAAGNGVYDQDFFGDARTHVGFKKRLRAVVQDLLLNYAKAMQTDCSQQAILLDSSVQIYPSDTRHPYATS